MQCHVLNLLIQNQIAALEGHCIHLYNNNNWVKARLAVIPMK